MRWEMTRWSIEMMKQTILRFAQRAKQLTSTSWRDECEYAREAWCCCQISSSCNVCTYILQFVSLLCEFRSVVSTTFSLFALSCFSFSIRAFANDNFLVSFLLVDINCISKHVLDLNSYARDTAIENLEFLNHSRRDRCKKEMIKKE